MIVPGTFVVPHDDQRPYAWCSLYPTSEFIENSSRRARFTGGIVVANVLINVDKNEWKVINALLVIDSKTQKIGWIQLGWVKAA